MQKKINLIHIPRRFTRNSWGGTETVILNSAKYLQDLDYNSEIYTTKALDKNPHEMIENIPIKRFNYLYPYFALPKKTIKAFDQIGGNLFSFSLFFKLLFKKDIDIIHLHTMKRLGGIGRTIAKIKKIPYVVTLHGGFYHIDQGETSHRQQFIKTGYEWGKILGFLTGSRRVLDDASAIITLSNEEYEKAKAIHKDKVYYLPNGVDIEKFSSGDTTSFKKAYNISQEKKIILCSGRIDTQKNQLLLLEAYKEILQSNHDTHLVLMGAISDENYFQKLQDFISQNDLNENVTFVSNLTPKDKLLLDAYKAAFMMVLPSRHEPFGMVILEAWGAKIPVVASSVGGIKKIIQNEKNGLLFENGNKDQLVEQITKMLEDQKLKNKIINNSIEDVKQYDWKEISKGFDKIYKTIL